MSDEIGAADGLTYTHHQLLVKTLGEPYASRLVSAEKLVSDFRSRRVATEIVAFGEAAQHARELAERALSNEVITPGKTTLEDVAWWMQDRLLERGLGTSFGMPSVYWSGPEGIIATSDGTIIRPGMLLHIDWGVCLMNLCTDMKRTAYVLKADESKPPAGIQHAWDQALKVREVIRRTIKPGGRAIDMLDTLNRAVAAAGFSIMKEFNKPSADARHRSDHRLPLHGQHRARLRAVDGHVAGAAEHLHAAADQHVRLRVLRLDARARVGRQEGPHPPRRRCHRHRARRGVAGARERADPPDQELARLLGTVSELHSAIERSTEGGGGLRRVAEGRRPSLEAGNAERSRGRLAGRVRCVGERGSAWAGQAQKAATAQQGVLEPENANEARLNRLQLPDRTMDAIGIQPGMTVAEIGAGSRDAGSCSSR